jgi:hypothetical protein
VSLERTRPLALVLLGCPDPEGQSSPPLDRSQSFGSISGIAAGRLGALELTMFPALVQALPKTSQGRTLGSQGSWEQILVSGAVVPGDLVV